MNYIKSLHQLQAASRKNGNSRFSPVTSSGLPPSVFHRAVPVAARPSPRDRRLADGRRVAVKTRSLTSPPQGITASYPYGQEPHAPTGKGLVPLRARASYPYGQEPPTPTGKGLIPLRARAAYSPEYQPLTPTAKAALTPAQAGWLDGGGVIAAEPLRNRAPPP